MSEFGENINADISLDSIEETVAEEVTAEPAAQVNPVQTSPEQDGYPQTDSAAENALLLEYIKEQRVRLERTHFVSGCQRRVEK